MSYDFLEDLFENIIPSIDFTKFDGKEINYETESNSSKEISINQETVNLYIELLQNKWDIVGRDLYGPTIVVDSLTPNGWNEERIEFTRPGHIFLLKDPIRTNLRVDTKVRVFNSNFVETDLIIELNSLKKTSDKTLQEFVNITNLIADFLSERMIGLEYFIRLNSNYNLGLQFVLPLYYTEKSEIFNYLKNKENKIYLLNKYLELISYLIINLFLKEYNKELGNFMENNSISLKASFSKSMVFSLDKRTNKITLPLPQNLLIENINILKHYMELMNIEEAFSRIDEIYEDDILDKNRITNTKILEFLFEVEFSEILKNLEE